MALIKCKECGQEISDKAEFCPRCGFPVNEKVQKGLSGKDVPEEGTEGAGKEHFSENKHCHRWRPFWRNKVWSFGRCNRRCWKAYSRTLF